MVLHVLVTQRTPRIEYIIDWVAKTHLGLDTCLFYENEADWKCSEGIHLNYSQQYIANYAFIAASDFLLTRKVHAIALEIQGRGDTTHAFATNNVQSLFHFDIFAWCFYLLSRYEEYLPYAPDQHGRFTAQQSTAYQYDFLGLPLVDIWCLQLVERIQGFYPQWKPTFSTYRFTPSYDIDYAYAFRYKGIKRQLGAAARNLFKGHWRTLKEQLKTWFGIQKDPFFTFDYLAELDQHYTTSSLYFFLVGDYGQYDKNVSYQHPKMQQLIQHVAQKNPVGWHPSYQSNTHTLEKLTEEYQRLNHITGTNITASRQHFLCLNFPTTYQRLLALGIQNEYSMGYANYIGFRASTAHSFPWYDLQKEQKTDLMIYPFQAMDVTLINYLKWDAQQILNRMEQLIEQIKAVRGHFIMINHNNSFCELGEWKGWRATYEKIMTMGSIAQCKKS